ncbi:MAG: NADPH-dependent 7-cyano-7-deazaguanine reductase QueF [Gammaproteobacteria bacterium]|nr:MAG: NADPH-dependent 7-cyano-7-deazaguanine reductase QueF [Gammaproteobacteria bacterium]
MARPIRKLPLVQQTDYIDTYTPSLLCDIPRKEGREKLSIDSENLPFHGVDIWNAYEISWLDSRGKPVVAVAEIQIPCSSPLIVESKSLKLYLNSYNQTRFNSKQEVLRTLESDLSILVRAPVLVKVRSESQFGHEAAGELPGTCIDNIDIDVDCYEVQPTFLTLDENPVKSAESLYSHLLKSNCPVTNQPDWASVVVQYAGPKIDRAGLLKYIISYRSHSEFHEQCIERMFMDIMAHCKPEHLTVYARYVRRGGIDINPFRSNYEEPMANIRLFRQ